jgi:hypothetical protein
MSRWLRLVVLAIAALCLAGSIDASPTYAYDVPVASHAAVREFGAVGATTALRSAAEGSASPAVEARGMSTTSSSLSVATNTGGALKGAIPDAVPSNLTQQLALTEARASGGTQIMANLVDNPRLVAVYGDGEWVKMQSVLRGTDVNTTVHWFKNLTTGLEVEFKFK